MAKENKFLNIGKKLLLVALPIIIQKGGEIVQEWAEKRKWRKQEDKIIWKTFLLKFKKIPISKY